MTAKYTHLFRIVFFLHIAFRAVQPLQMEFNIFKNGWQRVFIETDMKYNWFKAETACVRRNMSLIAVDTAERSAVLDSILRDNFEICPYLWIGGQDLGKEGQFVWISTGEPFNFTNWKKGMPDNFGNKEHCVHMAHGRDWNDIKCGFKFGFICEGRGYA